MVFRYVDKAIKFLPGLFQSKVSYYSSVNRHELTAETADAIGAGFGINSFSISDRRALSEEQQVMVMVWETGRPGKER